MRLLQKIRIFDIILVINTIRYLKWQQIYFRIKRKFLKPKVTDHFVGIIEKNPEKWVHHYLYEEKIDQNLNASFLNYSKKLNLPDDWNTEDRSKLWTYNLHYFEDLLCENAPEKLNFHLRLLNRWVDENPVGFGNGWEPYPTSLRIVNILKAWLGGNLELDHKLLSSVYLQASYLSNALEKHLLGNHYFSNLKALLFAGIIFNNQRWIKISEEGLIKEIPEQILRDGASFELSPMYHSLILVDMLDLVNLTRAYPSRVKLHLTFLLEQYVPKMLTFADSMAHPDGGVSFFNDSVDGIAPSKTKIEAYAVSLGFSIKLNDYNISKIIDNKGSGYLCAISGGSKLLFDVSAVGPDYIPGHAHADTLSFELSIGKERVFVNSGISEYGVTKRRIDQRKTRSHNTVEVNCKDSSQVWSGFRVANRAKIVSRTHQINEDKSISFKGAHDGYKTIFGGCIHSRKLTLSEGNLVICDELDGNFNNAVARFHFHPNLKVKIDNDVLTVTGDNFFMESDLTGKKAYLFDAVWYPEFGLEKDNTGLAIEFTSGKECICFTWSFHSIVG